MQDRHLQVAFLIGVGAIALRLIAINQPFIDQWSWRQSDVAAIARNFYTNGFHFAYPQIDWAGDQPGYVGTEFPILPFIAAISYKVIGVHEWVGRVQAVILFAFSLPFFFLLAQDVFGRTAATGASFFYCFAPLSVMTSRCFMPDMPSLSLSIIGLYFFRRWVDNERTTSLGASAALISLSILIKAPSVLIGAPLAYLAVRRFKLSTFRRLALWIFAAVALVPSAVWYWHAAQIAHKFYPHHFFGAGGIRLMPANWYWRIAQETSLSSLTAVLLGLALAGAFIACSDERSRFFHCWLGAMILFVIVAGYGNRHAWYRLPLVPIASVFAGAACAHINAIRESRIALSGERKPKRWRLDTEALLFALVALAISFSFLSYFSARNLYRESAADLRTAGLELKRTTPPGSLIAVADYGDTTVFYYAQRRGWHFLEKEGIYNGHPATDADATADLEALRRRGATHLVFYSATFWWLDYYKEFAERLAIHATLMQATPQFKIYRLDPP